MELVAADNRPVIPKNIANPTTMSPARFILAFLLLFFVFA